MERKEHPRAGCAEPSPMGCSRPAAGTGSQLLPRAWQDRALLHPYFIASSLAALQGWVWVTLVLSGDVSAGAAGRGVDGLCSLCLADDTASSLVFLPSGAGGSCHCPQLPGSLAPLWVCSLAHREAVRGCGFPVIPRFYIFLLWKAHHLLPTVEQLIQELCGGGHSAELEHKSWGFTEAAFLAAVPSYHRLYYIFISLPMLIPVFIPWCSACLCWQMTLAYIVYSLRVSQVCFFFFFNVCKF